MGNVKKTILWLCSVFFLYAAWSGYVEEEMKGTLLEGKVTEKLQSKMAVNQGINVLNQDFYKIRLSSGKDIMVNSPDYHSIKKGDHVIFVQQHDRLSLYKKEKG